MTDEKKEEDSAIGLLILDNDRVEFLDRTRPEPNEMTFQEKVQRFQELLWSGASPMGKKLYDNEFKCSSCHGEKGDGKGPLASIYDPKPTNFRKDASFWMGDVNKKIEQAVGKGKGQMKKIDMKPVELKAVVSYIKRSLGRYMVYKIIDGNQQPRPLDPNCDKIVVQTRSILQVFNYLAEFVQVPTEHIAQNRTRNRSKYLESLKGPINFEVKCSKGHPEDSFVAVQKNGYWFYIDDKDPNSKRVFSGIAGILSMSEPGTKEGTPVLTLPVQ